MLQKHTTWMLCMLASVTTVLAGCPPTNNQDNNGVDLGQGQEDMTTSPEDMSGEPDPDMGEDMSEDLGGEPDMQSPEDMAIEEVDATCFVQHIAPATLPLDAEPGPLTWVVSCNAPLSSAQLGERVDVTRQRGEQTTQALSVDGVDCQESEDAWRCSITTSGLSAPAGPYEQLLGPESLSFEDSTGQAFASRVRWHLSNTELAPIQDTFDDVPLPAGYGERGLGVQKLAVDGGFVLFGAMVNSAGDGVEIFDVDLQSTNPSVRVHETIEVAVGDLAASDFQVRLVGNAVQVIWWGFDASTGQFTGHLAKFNQDTSLLDSHTLDENAYTGPKLVRILDTHLGTQETSSGSNLGVRAVAITESNTLAIVRVFSSDSSNQVVLERQLDGIGGVLPSELGAGSFGVLDLPGSLPDLDAEVGKSWVASANGIDWISLDGVSFGSRLSTSVQWPFSLDMVESNQGEIVGFASNEAGEEELFVVSVNDDGKPSSLTSLEMPTGVDFGSSGLSGAHIEAETLTMFGRWPWNWRDKLKVAGEPDGAMMIAQWNLKVVEAGAAHALTSVRPMLVTDAAASASAGDLVIQSVTEDGALRTIPVAAVTAACATPEECAVQVSNRTPNGFAMMLVPGVSGATMAIDKYGDILIDGVPLEFDLIGSPWTFDKPGEGTGTITIATVDSEVATHAIWDMNEDGSIKGSGLLDFATKEGSPTLDADVVIRGGTIADYAAGADPDSVMLHFSATRMVRAPKGEVVGTEEIHGTLPLARLLVATTSRAPVTVDLSNTLPEVVPAGDAISVLPPAVSAPLFSGAIDENSGDEDVILATLTAEQAALPLEVRITGGKFQVSTKGKDGDSALLEEAEATTSTLENPIFVSSSGASTNVLSKSSAAFSGKIRRVRIKKRPSSILKPLGPASLEEDIEGVGVVYEVVLETREVALEGLGERAFIQDFGDFNGDGVEDVSIGVGSRDDADLSGENTVIYFGDGLTGYLMVPYSLTGGPNVSWPPVQEAAAGNGKGTRKASAQIKQQQQLELL